jgi:hypothetical protein
MGWLGNLAFHLAVNDLTHPRKMGVIDRKLIVLFGHP